MEAARDDSAARLYADAAHGNTNAAVELLQEYLPRLRAFVRARLDPEMRRRESASDVVQSVCRELLEAKDTFCFAGESQFRGWLFTAALNKVREKGRFHHQEKRSMAREERAGSDFAAPNRRDSADPSCVVLANERTASLEAALDRMTESDREVIGLARLAGLPMAEVAARLGKNEAAARRQLGRALLRLAAELERHGARGGRT